MSPLSNDNSMRIRPAGKEDAALIMRFIRELAAYEKLSHQVVADEEMICEALFGAKPYAEAIIGECMGDPVGFALFYPAFSTFMGKPGIYLEDLFVIPSMRGKGFGKAFLKYLAQLALDRGFAKLEWEVLDWNEPAIRFYESLGAVIHREWLSTSLRGAALQRLAES